MSELRPDVQEQTCSSLQEIPKNNSLQQTPAQTAPEVSTNEQMLTEQAAPPASSSSSPTPSDLSSSPPSSPSPESQSAKKKRSYKKRNNYTPTLKEVTDLFHLPIDEAAKSFNICVSKLKKVCREYNIVRWPYRKKKASEAKEVKTIEELRKQPNIITPRIEESPPHAPSPIAASSVHSSSVHQSMMRSAGVGPSSIRKTHKMDQLAPPQAQQQQQQQPIVIITSSPNIPTHQPAPAPQPYMQSSLYNALHQVPTQGIQGTSLPTMMTQGSPQSSFSSQSPQVHEVHIIHHHQPVLPFNLQSILQQISSAPQPVQQPPPAPVQPAPIQSFSNLLNLLSGAPQTQQPQPQQQQSTMYHSMDQLYAGNTTMQNSAPHHQHTIIQTLQSLQILPSTNNSNPPSDSQNNAYQQM